MILISIFIHFSNCYGLKIGQVWGETDRRLINIYIKLCWLWLEMFWIILIYESRTQPLYCDRQYGWYKGTADRPQWETDWKEQSASGEGDRSSPGQKFSCYGNWRVITAFKKARHVTLSWDRSTQFKPSPTSWQSISIFSSHQSLDLAKDYFPQGPPPKFYGSHLSTIRTTCSNCLIFLDLVTPITFSEQYIS